jgi:hypothetical protein
MRLNLRVVNDELARLGLKAELAKGSGYFFFRGGEAGDWIDRTVAARTINTLTLKPWVEEYRRLKALNEQIMKTVRSGSTAAAEDKPKRS